MATAAIKLSVKRKLLFECNYFIPVSTYMDRKNTGFRTEVKWRRGAGRSRLGETIVDEKSLWIRNPVLIGEKSQSLHHKSSVGKRR